LIDTLRFRSKPIVALSIVLVLASALGGWHAPDDVDDFGTQTTQQRTNHDARVTTETRPTAPEHCALCHWLQALSKAAPVSPQQLARESFELVHAGVPVERARTADRLAVPSRAPPLA
jgi:hypothetical protein